MAVSSMNDSIGSYIADNSDFCPVLATGLSGLYSSLPRKLNIPSDDWYQLTEDDVSSIPEIVQFLNSLEFCNAVVQVAHPIVRNQLLSFIFTGFLVPVLGPALHQSSMEEVVAATSYLDLFLRRITEPALMQTFVKFIVSEKHDDVIILDSLITRINSSSRLCMVSLALFMTLVDLNCEDIMFQLVFKHLIPCTHVMVSQRRAVKDLDIYSKTAEKFLSLTPSCCTSDFSESPEGASTPVAPGSPKSITSIVSSSSSNASPDKPSRAQRIQGFFSRKTRQVVTPGSDHTVELQADGFIEDDSRSSSPDPLNSSYPNTYGKKLEHFQTSYIEYLQAARTKIIDCAQMCECWSAPYDGENPSPDSILLAIDTPTPMADDETTPVVENGTVLDSPVKLRSATAPADLTGERQRAGSRSREGTPSRFVENIVIESHGQSPRGSPHGSSVELRKSTETKSNDDANHCENTTKEVRKTEEGENEGAESVVSDADNSLRTDIAQSSQEDAMNDKSDPGDLEAFLRTLKRVQTPVEICDSIEESFHEMDALISDIKSSPEYSLRQTSSASRSDSTDLPSFANLINGESNAIKPTAWRPAGSEEYDDSASNTLNNTADLSKAPSDEPSTKLEEKLSEFGMEKKTLDMVPQRTTSISETPKMMPITRPMSFGSVVASKYSTAVPNIGSFLSALLGKLETMMQNSLYVNLLLTGLINRLCCYPQPLLRSYLLNHSLVFQPTVKSLSQVLSSVKHKVDCYSYTVKDFETLLLRARRFLAWREDVAIHGGDGRNRTDSLHPNANVPKSTERADRRRSSTFSDFIFRRNNQASKAKGGAAGLRGQLMAEGKGYRYINQDAANLEKLESVKTKNAVYCALVLEEFLKELAAISQEHTVSYVQDSEGIISNPIR